MQFTNTLIAALSLGMAAAQVCMSGTFTGTTTSSGCSYSLDATVTDGGATVCSGTATQTGAGPSWALNCIAGASATVSSTEGAFFETYTSTSGVTTGRSLTESTPPFGRDCTVQPWTSIPECA